MLSNNLIVLIKNNIFQDGEESERGSEDHPETGRRDPSGRVGVNSTILGSIKETSSISRNIPILRKFPKFVRVMQST